MEQNEITRYRPSYFTDMPTHVVQFTSKESLLSIPWIRNFENETNFHKFSMNHPVGNFLMAEYDKGLTWWVVGICKHPVNFLPEFKS